jgi:D-alanyl-D-alanine carboxypeptidase/D-alanyl-D-alanine-endopeptidase (penicillin-binding protein 4)
MTEWLRAQAATKSARFVDHSGLGPDSRISAEEMASVLVRLGPRAGLRGLMKAAPLGEGGEGLKGKVLVEAKTGTLNFVSALAGYVTAPGGAEFAFAIFTGDVDRREAAAASGEEIPPGGPAWAKRSRKLQQQLIARWVTLYG